MNLSIYDLHPIAVHFTIAFFSIATLLFVILRLPFFSEKNRERFSWLADFALFLGFFATIGTALCGLIAYLGMADLFRTHAVDKKILDHHHFWMAMTFLFYGTATFLRIYACLKTKKTASMVIVILMLAGFCSVFMTGYYGGKLSYQTIVDSL